MSNKEPKNREATWHVTIDELVEIFRNALVSLVPTFEKAQIGWSADENYDDFDRVAEALYDSIVRDSIKSAVGLHDATPLQRYGFSFSEGRTHSRLTIEHDNFAFVAFVTRDNPFDHVLAEMSDSSAGAQRLVIKYGSASFQLQPFGLDGQKKSAIRELTVEL